MNGRPLLPRLLIRGRIGLFDCLADALEDGVEPVVRDVQVVDDALERRGRFNVVTYRQQKPMGDVDED